MLMVDCQRNGLKHVQCSMFERDRHWQTKYKNTVRDVKMRKNSIGHILKHVIKMRKDYLMSSKSCILDS